jgi:Uma2 family endonuclease
MGTMTVLPRSLPLTRADLASMPDDGHRHELIDGVLVVTPVPSIRHQAVLAELYHLLRHQCPAGFTVLFAPSAVALAEDTELQPDLLVARTADFTAKELPRAPLLAVEILSPSTRRFDLTLKRDRLEAAGCEAYWCIDPDELTLTAWQLEQGRFVEVAHVSCDETFETELPFPLSIRPADLSPTDPICLELAESVGA